MTSKTLATLLVLGVGCGGDTSPTQPLLEPAGSLSITVNGIVTSVSTAGSISVVRTSIANDSVRTFTVPVSGSLSVRLPIGQYRVTYVAPGGYTAVSTLATADVERAPPAVVAFYVSQTRYFFGLIVNLPSASLGPAPPDSVAVIVLRSDIANQLPDTVWVQPSIDLPNPGYETTVGDLLPGIYSLTLVPPAGYAIPAGDSGVRSIMVDERCCSSPST